MARLSQHIVTLAFALTAGAAAHAEDKIEAVSPPRAVVLDERRQLVAVAGAEAGGIGGQQQLLQARGRPHDAPRRTGR